MKETTATVLAEVAEERYRQDLKFPGDLVAGHVNGTGGLCDPITGADVVASAKGREEAMRALCEEWKDRYGVGNFALILDEEVSEAFAATTVVDLRKELIQVAAVAVKWVEYLDAVEERRRADAARALHEFEHHPQVGPGESIVRAVGAIAPVGTSEI